MAITPAQAFPATQPPAVAYLSTAVHDTGGETRSEIGADAPLVWQCVLEYLSGTLPRSMVRQNLLPLRAEHATDGTLRPLAPKHGAALWLDRMLRRRIEDALAELGYGSVQVQIGSDDEACALAAS
jgi:hypothetical protein